MEPTWANLISGGQFVVVVFFGGVLWAKVGTLEKLVSTLVALQMKKGEHE